jgi:HK97 family phage prohead protease
MQTNELQLKRGGSGVAVGLGEGDAKTFPVGGYMTRWGIWDNGRDVTRRGSTLRAIADKTDRLLLWSHEAKLLPLGTARLLREDNDGCLFSGKIVMDTQMGGDVAALLKATGEPSGISYRYDCQSREVRHPDGGVGRELTEIYPISEVSICNFPMLETARLNAVGEAKTALTRAIQDRILIHWTETKMDAKSALEKSELDLYMEAMEREFERTQDPEGLGRTFEEWRHDWQDKFRKLFDDSWCLM